MGEKEWKGKKKTSRPYCEFVQARSARLVAEVRKEKNIYISEKLTSLPCMIKHRASSVNTGAGQRTPIYGEKKGGCLHVSYYSGFPEGNARVSISASQFFLRSLTNLQVLSIFFN